MHSLEERIITSISKRGKGTIVSPLDYAGYPLNIKSQCYFAKGQDSEIELEIVCSIPAKSKCSFFAITGCGITLDY